MREWSNRWKITEKEIYIVKAIAVKKDIINKTNLNMTTVEAIKKSQAITIKMKIWTKLIIKRTHYLYFQTITLLLFKPYNVRCFLMTFYNIFKADSLSYV